VARQRGQAGAEDEQEQHRLDQAGHGPQPVALEPDQLAVPDDADGAQVLPQRSGTETRMAAVTGSTSGVVS